MSFKSLAMLTLGRLKKGLKETLTMVTLGRLSVDKEIPDEPVSKGDTFVKPGRMVLSRYNVQTNNNVILLAESSLF